MEIGEYGPLSRQSIQVWCLYGRMAKAAKITPAPIIRKDKNDIWFVCHGNSVAAGRVIGKALDGTRAVAGRGKAAFLRLWLIEDGARRTTWTPNIRHEHPALLDSMSKTLIEWQDGCSKSVAGKDCR